MDWRRRLGWIALFVLLSGGPVLIATCFAPSGARFLGGLASPDDVSVYLAAQYQGTRGAWLYRPPFDPTLAPPLVMYTLYLALGHLARSLVLDLTLVYHLARLAGGVLVLVVAARWSMVLFNEKYNRSAAWVAVAFSSGLGWLLSLVPVQAWQAQLIDLRSPEASTFLSVFTAPHFALGIVCEALSLLAFWQALERPKWGWWALLSGGSLLGLGLVYPFTIPVVYATLGGYVTWSLWQKGWRRGKKALWVAAVSSGVPLPFVVYYVNVFFFSSFWKGTHVVQNVIPTPGVGWLAAGYGLPLALAAWGGVCVVTRHLGVGVLASRSLRRGVSCESQPAKPSTPLPGVSTNDLENQVADPWALICMWAVVNGLVLFLPVTFRWRMANGWHFCLALLAVHGLENGLVPWVRHGRRLAFLRHFSSNPLATLRRVVIILMVPSTLMVSLIGVRIALVEGRFPYYVSLEELGAMASLSEYVDFDDVVLGAYQTGNVLPTRALCRVVVGQQFSTLDPMKKLGDVSRFFASETPDVERQVILRRYGVTVVYYGRWERLLGEFDPGDAPYLFEMVRHGETVVYRVQSAE